MRVFDLESEPMRGASSIPTGDNIFSLDLFCFHTVKMKMPILAFYAYGKNANEHMAVMSIM